MNNKNTAIIATLIAALLCGCPGLVSLCMGLITAVASRIPGSQIDIVGSHDPGTALATGIALLCGGAIFILIPIVVGILLLRKKPAPAPAPTSNEPIPPAI
jgi:hypothetical protein